MMAMYRTCPLCGNNLDPGERCDCQEQKENERHERNSLCRDWTRERECDRSGAGIPVCVGKMLAWNN